MKNTKNTLIISEDIINNSSRLTKISDEIKSLNNTKKTLIKDTLNMVLSEIKEISEDDNYITYNKKALAQIVGIRLDAKVENILVRNIIKSVIIYLVSKSSLNFNDTKLTHTKFINGMKLINNQTNTVSKFKDNKELFKAVDEDNKIKLINRANKIAK